MASFETVRRTDEQRSALLRWVLLALRLVGGMVAWGLSVLSTHFLLDWHSWRASIIAGLVPFFLVVLFAPLAGDEDD
jgi:hypothetical protein